MIILFVAMLVLTMVPFIIYILVKAASSPCPPGKSVQISHYNTVLIDEVPHMIPVYECLEDKK